MSVFLGQVVITAELLNKIVKPFILSRQPVVSSIDFLLEKGEIIFRARGRYLLQFRAAGTVNIVRFNFGPGGHILTLAVEVHLYPRYLTLLARNPLEKVFAEQPGLRFRGNLLEVDLKKIPLLAAIGKITLGGAELFSLLEITAAGRSEEGLLFDLSLADQEFSFYKGPAGI